MVPQVRVCLQADRIFYGWLNQICHCIFNIKVLVCAGAILYTLTAHTSKQHNVRDSACVNSHVCQDRDTHSILLCQKYTAGFVERSFLQYVLAQNTTLWSVKPLFSSSCDHHCKHCIKHQSKHCMLVHITAFIAASHCEVLILHLRDGAAASILPLNCQFHSCLGLLVIDVSYGLMVFQNHPKNSGNVCRSPKTNFGKFEPSESAEVFISSFIFPRKKK